MGLLDWINPISSAVNAVTGAIGLVDTVTGGADHRAREMARYQAELNEQSAEKSYERQLDFWNKQNEYDLPTNQLARYQAAGINPNSVFGQVSANAAGAPSTPVTSAPDLASSQMAQYQRQALALQSARQMADTALIRAQTRNIDADSDIKEANLPWVDKLNYVEVNLKDAQTFKTDKEKELYQKEIEKADEQIKEIRATVEEIQARIANTNQSTINLFQQYCQNDKSFDKLLKNMDMDIQLKGAQITSLRTQCLLVLSQVTGQNLDNSYQRQINAFGAKTFNDKVAMYRFNRGLLGFQYEGQKLQMPSLRRLGGLNIYLDTTDKAVNVVDKFFDVYRKNSQSSRDNLDFSLKPMQMGENFLNFAK